MKVIFLDIDGVLNVYGSPYCGTRDEFGDMFHKEFVDNLRWIIEQTGAVIVISSSWRFEGLAKMQLMWEMRDLPGKVIAVTPSEQVLVNEGIAEFYDQVCRGMEIQYWLDRCHQPVTNYVIIDDDKDFLPHQTANFVRTANNNHHPDCIDTQGLGLTRKCAERAVEILNAA